ncbi:MAG TPA: extracellular solute-binding protein, partial [Nitrospirota bacterium]|nr:extracellular solute-binding protein [Nitrospirota bacterium]
WVTGPWNADTLRKSGLSFKVVQVPAIAQASVPFLGVQGFMVTKFASVHNVDSAAKDLVTNFMATASAQTQLAAANGRPPANIKAQSSDPVLQQFSAASKGGVPMPNIPQMNSVWSDLGQAWAGYSSPGTKTRKRTLPVTMCTGQQRAAKGLGVLRASR